MNNTELADIIELAADKLELCPWGQGHWRSDQGQICAEDAISMAILNVNNIDDRFKAIEALTDKQREDSYDIEFEVTDHLGERVGVLLHVWNDAPERTKDEVVELFRTAVKDLRNEATP